MRSIPNSGIAEHNVILCENGDVYSFGQNGFVQCGTEDSDDMFIPTKIMNNPNILSIVLGRFNSFYLERNGDLYACGLNKNNQLKHCGQSVRVKFEKITFDVDKICASETYTFIQKKNGKIYFVGEAFGNLKREFMELKINDVESFSCGKNHSLFLKKNKEVWVLGSNEFGQCGKSDTKNFSVPYLLMEDKNIVSVCCGYNYSCILSKNDKGETSIKFFGTNTYGELGSLGENRIVTIDQFPNIKSVHCGYTFSLILLENGDVYSCGSNYYGQLGLGNHSKVTSFQKIDISNIIMASIGSHHSVFVNNKKRTFRVRIWRIRKARPWSRR
eukprot:TRINITY_DN4619_c0_g1_i1.p1 TRINITY_DN4619_c0_g1~~TRINITY_DN4619_c0_g1_i1.p1  ORF type:complete len:329 (+),score=38.34 TRINITY_DN4619_c0_g1_i1:381-1367(+)